jgi:hypothetical protein
MQVYVHEKEREEGRRKGERKEGEMKEERKKRR